MALSRGCCRCARLRRCRLGHAASATKVAQALKESLDCRDWLQERLPLVRHCEFERHRLQILIEGEAVGVWPPRALHDDYLPEAARDLDVRGARFIDPAEISIDFRQRRARKDDGFFAFSFLLHQVFQIAPVAFAGGGAIELGHLR